MNQTFKASLWSLALVGVICAIGFNAGAQSNVPIHKDQGGALLTVDSGGTLNIAAGGKFEIQGVQVTASAAELNSGAGNSLSTEELAVLADVVPGTSAASKAVVLDSSSKINTLDLTGVKIGGVTKTTALAAAVTTPVAGVAAGYVVARGETALDGSNPTPITTGLTSIIACTVSIKSTSAPGVGTSVLSYGTSSGTLNAYAWKSTSNVDATFVASTGTETVGWVCVGT